MRLTTKEFVALLRDEYNIFMSPYAGAKNVIRLRTHYWIDRKAIDKVIKAVSSVLS